MLTVATGTHTGRVRTNNEDALFCDSARSWFAVADGMGGHNAGEVASKLALDAMGAFLRKSASSDDFTWPFGVNPDTSFAANRLTTA